MVDSGPFTCTTHMVGKESCCVKLILWNQLHVDSKLFAIYLQAFLNCGGLSFQIPRWIRQFVSPVPAFLGWAILLQTDTRIQRINGGLPPSFKSALSSVWLPINAVVLQISYYTVAQVIDYTKAIFHLCKPVSDSDLKPVLICMYANVVDGLISARLPWQRE